MPLKKEIGDEIRVTLLITLISRKFNELEWCFASSFSFGGAIEISIHKVMPSFGPLSSHFSHL